MSANLWRLAAALLLLAFACIPGVAQQVVHLGGSTLVGAKGAVQTVSVPVVRPGTLTTIRVLTQGSAGLDFTDAGSGACKAGASLLLTPCAIDVAFTPTAPGVRTGAVILLGSNGEVLGTQLLDEMAIGPLAVIRPGLVSTVAGNGQWIYHEGSDNVAATQSPLFLPSGVVTTAAGDVYIADSSNNRIRRVDGKTGVITTYVGTGDAGHTGDNGKAIYATVSNPAGLAMDGAGNLYIADSGNNAVRRVDAQTGTISTYAGGLLAGGLYVEGLDANSAALVTPNGVALDVDGNLYIADTGSHAVRRVDAKTHLITTVAGGNGAGLKGDGLSATAAQLSSPWSLAFGPAGQMYIADLNNNAVRVVTSGIITTIVGYNGQRGFSGDGAAATKALLNTPAAIAVDPLGNLYIADAGNNRIRKVDALTGIITTICGTNETSITDVPTNSDGVNLYGPYALYLDGGANLFVADLFHNRVRVIAGNTANLLFPTMKVGKLSDPIVMTLENDGTGTLAKATIVSDQAQLDAATTTCTGTVLSGAQCKLGVVFAPLSVSAPALYTFGSLDYKTDAGNSPVHISTFATVLSVEPTTVALTSSLNPAALAANITLTATVSSKDTGRTGTVTFFDGATSLGVTNLNSSGVATFTTSTLTLGQHTLTAKYSGDASNAASLSTELLQSVLQPTQTVVTSALNPSTVNGTVVFTATVQANTAVTSGSVTFLDGSTTLGTGTIGSNSIATFSTAALSAGTHNITAKFAGDTSNAASTSAVLAQVVKKASSTTLLAVSAATAPVGAAVTLTATVASDGGPAVTGTVTFRNGTATLGTATVDGSGKANFTVSTLPAGTDSISAVYAGDASNESSTSSGVAVTVTKLQTVTSLTSSIAQANAGSALSLTATVTLAPNQQAAGTLTGSIAFYDGSALVGTVTIGANGIAVLSTSALAAGSHTLVATYSGDSSYSGSSSTTLAQAVQKTATTTSLSASVASLIAGSPVTLTSSVNNAGVKATGTVTFSDASGLLGTATLNGSAVATLTLPSLLVGSHTVTATYAGDGNYLTSASASTVVTVRLGTSSLVLTASGAQITYGQQLVLTPTLLSDGKLSSPSVVLQDNGVALATVALNSAGTASYATKTLSVGTHTLTASYAGDSGNAAATSQAVTVVVKAAPTAVTLISSKNPALFGDGITYTATVTSDVANVGGTVSFNDGGTVLATAPVNAGGVATTTVSTLALGQHNIIATYTGDATHAVSASTTLAQQVLSATVVTLQSGINPVTAGLNLQFTAQVSGSSTNTGVTTAPTGTVTLHEGATVLGTQLLNGTGAALFSTASLAVGTHNLTASYSGDALYRANDSTVLLQVVQIAHTQTTLATSAAALTYGAPLTLTAQVLGNGSTATGAVTFLDGTTAIGQVKLNAVGSAVLTTSALAPGMHNIVASYEGDNFDDASRSAAAGEQVQQAAQVSLVASSNPALTLDKVVLTAAVRNAVAPVATGTVRFMDGATLLGTATLDGAGNAVFTADAFTAGSHALVSVYSGDVSDFAATSATVTLPVNLRVTQNLLTSAAGTGGNVSLISVLRWTGPVTPTGTITFHNAAGVIGTGSVDATGVATLTVTSSVAQGSIVASYGGDASYAASDSASTDTAASSPTNFTLTMSPASMSVPTKKYVTGQIIVRSVSGFSDTIALGCVGLPWAATCTFDKSSFVLQPDGSTTIKVTIDTGSPLTSGGEVAKTATPQRTSAVLCFLPAGALVGWLIFRQRRRIGTPLLLLLLLLLTLPVVGCGSISVNGTPTGDYSFAISAVGQKTGVTLSQAVTLKVTQ